MHNSIKHTFISEFNEEGHKAITIRINDKSIFSSDLHVTSYYAPPHGSRHKSTLNIKLIEKSLNYKHAAILGDLNARHIDLGCLGSNLNGKHLRNFLLDTDHLIANDTSNPTFFHVAHNFSDCLDYCIVTKDLLPHIINCSTSKDLGSDHLPLAVIFKNQHRVIHSNNDNNTLNYKLTNWDHFQENLKDKHKGKMPSKINTTDDLEHFTNNFIEDIKSALVESTPKHRTPNPANPRLPPQVLRLINTRRHLRKTQKSNNSTELRKEINELNKAIKKEIESVKKEIMSNKISVIEKGTKDPNFWPTVKSLLNTNKNFQTTIIQNGSQLTTPIEKADAFAAHFKSIFTESIEDPVHSNFHSMLSNQLPNFQDKSQRDPEHPLTKNINISHITKNLKKTKSDSAPGPDKITYRTLKNLPLASLNKLAVIYNAVLDLAHFPLAFKTSIITVVPKPGKDPTLVTSYRPITLTSTVGKLLEKIINSRLSYFASQQNIIKTNQTGFRQNYEAAQNVVHLIQDTVQNFNNNKNKLLITFDLKQAFDRTWHEGLLHTVFTNTSCHFTKIINSFLSNRKINIRINGTLSSLAFSPIQGVPQGSSLSPTLFNIFLSTAPLVSPPNTHIYNYADDTSFTSTHHNFRAAWQQLQPLVNAYLTWTKKYKLLIQPEKTKALFFTRKRAVNETEYPTIIIDKINIPRSTQLKLLGVQLDIHLTMRHHIDNITAGTQPLINKIRNIFTKHRSIPPRVGTYLYKSLIRTKFTYANPVLLIIKPTSWRTLTHIENKALRAAHRTGIRTRISHLLKISHMTPIEVYYKEISSLTLLRYCRNKHLDLIAPIFDTSHAKNIVQWTPPLNIIFNSLSDILKDKVKTDFIYMHS